MKYQIKSLERLVSCLIIFILVSTAFAGSPLITHVSGTPTNSQNSGGSDDTGSGVDPASGTFHQTIPLLNILGRGVDVQLNLRYSSRIWEADPDGPVGNNNIAGVPEPLSWNGNHQWLEDYSPVGLGFELSMGRLYGTRYKCHQNDGGIPHDYYWYRFSFEDPDGGRIMFVSDNPDYRSGQDAHFIAADESGATLLVTWDGDGTSPNSYPTSMTVVLPSGIRYDFNTLNGLLGRENTGFGPAGILLTDGGGEGGGGSSGSPSLFGAERFTKILNDVNKVVKSIGKGKTVPPDFWIQNVRDQFNTLDPFNFNHHSMYPCGGGSHYIAPIIPGVTEETGSASWVATSIRDMNDNTVTITYYSHPDSTYTHFLSVPQIITDTYDRTITFTAQYLRNGQGVDQPLFDPTNLNSYPTIRLTDITTSISTTGEDYTIHFTYQNDQTDPYQIITTGPFLEEGTGHPRQVTTQKGDIDNARTRVILEGITITPTGNAQPRTTSFSYNTNKELTTITLYTGAQQTISYWWSQIASCYRYDRDGYPIETDIGRQPLHVVSSIQINGDGQTSRVEYTYLVHPSIEGYDDLPDHICFNKVIEKHLGTNKRIEYTYYSNTPWDALRREPWGEIFSQNGFSALTGLLKSITTYQDDNFNDNDPGILKQQNQLFYSDVPRIYDHLNPDYTRWTDQQYANIYIHGNNWQFICPMGFTSWQDGASQVTIRGIDGYGLHHEYYYPERDTFAGFRTYWTIQSDEFHDPTQLFGERNIEFFVWFTNPTHVKIQTTNILYQAGNDGQTPVNLPYYEQGLGSLVSQINEGEVTTWSPDNTPGYFDVAGYYTGTSSYFGTTGNPFSYQIVKTTDIQYDSVPLIHPAGNNPTNPPYYHGLITQQHVVQTGELTQNQYYTNGLLYQTHNYVIENLGSITSYYYDDGNTGFLSRITTTDPFNSVTTTAYEHNPIGQTTCVQDVDNGDAQTYTYDGYGRQLTHTINSNTVEETVYRDDFSGGYSQVTTTTSAGPNPQDQTITQTLYDNLNRPICSHERNGDETQWKTYTDTTYDANGHIDVYYLPAPWPTYGRHTTYDSYDIFGRVTQTTDASGRTTTIQTIPITEPVNERDPNYPLWQRGIRTKTVSTGSWGAQTITFSDAQGHTIQTSEKINNNVYADTKYYYDEGGRLWKQVSPEGLVTYYYYDAVGRLVATNTPDETADFTIAHGTDYQYPNDDYIDGAQADTLIEAFTWNGQPLRIHTAQGFFFYTYDQLGRLTRKTFSTTRNGPQTIVEEYSYNPQDAAPGDDPRCIGRLTKSTYYDQGNYAPYVVKYCYGEMGLMQTQLVAFAADTVKIIQFNYDWLGRLTTFTYPNNGDVLNYFYQGPRLTTITLNGRPLAGAQYDNFRRLATLTFGTSNVSSSYAYNDRNDFLTQFTVTQKVLQDTHRNELGGGIGNPSGGNTITPIDDLIDTSTHGSIDLIGGSQDKSVNDVTHIGGSSEVALLDSFQGTKGDVSLEASQDTLTSLGDIIKAPDITGKDPQTIVKDPGTTVKNPGTTVKSPGSIIKNPGTTVKKPGNMAQDPKQTQAVYTFSTLLQERYSYYNSGELHEVTDQAGVLKQRYGYDLMGRLIWAAMNHVQYDRTTDTFSSYQTNLQGFYSNITYTLNKDDVRTTKRIQDYHSFNPDDDITYQNSITSGTHQLHDVTVNGNTVFYQTFDPSGSVTNYNGDSITRDCLGQMTSYTHNNVVETYGYIAGMRVRQTTASGTIYSLYLGSDVLAEYYSNGALIRNNYYGFGQRLATKDNTGALSYLVTDPHGNLRCIVPATSQGSVWQGTYTPFGELIGRAQPLGQIGFDGYLRENTGLTYAYARDYDEKHSVFLSMDPLNEGSNPYSYCSGNPLAGRDPTGLNEVPEIVYTFDEGGDDTGPRIIPPGMTLQTPDQADAQSEFNAARADGSGYANPDENSNQQSTTDPDPAGVQAANDWINNHEEDICTSVGIFVDGLVDANPPGTPFYLGACAVSTTWHCVEYMYDNAPTDTLTIYNSPWNAPFGSGPGPNH